MARLLLVPVAVVAFIEGLLGLALALAGMIHAVPGGMAHATLDPGVAAAARAAALGAALVTVLAILPGLGAALAFRRFGKPVRYLAACLALLLLLTPAPVFDAVSLLHGAFSAPALLALAGATARSAALVMLVLLAGLRAVPAHLQRAAILAGARPAQAWRHAVLAPLSPYLAAAAAAAFALAFGAFPVAVARPLAVASSWTVPACLLLAGAGLAGMLAMLLPRREA